MATSIGKSKKSSAIAVAAALLAFSPLAGADLTGHLDLVSKYYLRGITTTYLPEALGNAGGDAPEADGPALQGGLDYSHSSGLYLGYFFSTLTYSYKSFNDQGVSTEQDVYGGYAGKVGDFGYKLGLTRYQYVPGFHSTGLETLVGVSYKEFGANAQTLLDDVTFGNKGDTYWTFTYNTPLPSDFGFNATLGYYTYGKTGEFINKDGSAEAAGAKVDSSAFRHLTLGITYPFMKNLTGGLNYIVGGKNRFDVDQDNKVWGSLSYTF